jgi:hypothetical protein
MPAAGLKVGAAAVFGVFGVEGQLISTSDSASKGTMRRTLDMFSSSGRSVPFRRVTKGTRPSGRQDLN